MSKHFCLIFLSGLIFFASPCLAEDGPGHAELIKGILKRMTEGSMDDVVKAGIALQEFASTEDIPLMTETLKEGMTMEARITIIEVLGALNDPSASDALRFEIEHGKFPAQLAALEALGRIRHDWGVSVIARVLARSGSSDLEKRAASALGQIGSLRAQETLEELREGRSRSTKRVIDWALKVAKEKVTPEQTTKEISPGRKMEMYFKGIKYLLYVPSYRPKSSPKPRVLVCVHGDDLNINDLYDLCQPTAREQKMVLVVPQFDVIRFPNYGELNYRGERADLRLLEIVDFLKERADLATREIYLYGYDRGGNFVERFAMAHPGRIARAAFYATDFTFPDPEAFFPTGVRTHLRAPDLAIDPYSFTKTDAALIFSAGTRIGREAERFFTAWEDYAVEQGINSRIAKRNGSTQGGETLESAWWVGQKFLFSEN